MIIDPSKVSLNEKDIEDYLWENPEALSNNFILGIRWVKRQYAVPSGIIDLLGVTDTGSFVVVEVKNVAIDASALTQVSRYAYDIYQVITSIHFEKAEHCTSGAPFCYKAVIGRSIDTKTMLEAEALDVEIIVFSVSLTLNTDNVILSGSFNAERSEKWKDLQSDKDIETVVLERARNYSSETDGAPDLKIEI